MSVQSSEMRVLIVGVEHYREGGSEAKRPGTLQALREIDQRLQQGGWRTRLLTDDASANARRSGLTQILEGLDWLSAADQSLLVMSGRVKSQRFYPVDYKSSFVQQSTLSLRDLMSALSVNTGLILDGSAAPELTQHLPWSIVAHTEEVEEELFGTFGPTVFLHSIVVSLNTWPFTEELKVKDFFECYQRSGAPSSAYHNYSSLESVSLLTPSLYEDTQSGTRIPETQVGSSMDSSSHSSLASASVSGSGSDSSRGGRFLSQGRFQLLRVIGEGGIGQVFLARDVQLNQYRAIKVLKIPKQLSDDQHAHIRGRMIQAVKAAQELSAYTHHVVQVYEVGIDEATELPFMVMEYLEGITLNSRLYREPRLTLEQVFEIGLTLCETLAIAHKRNVIHRDLKPENVMLINRGGSDLFVKLLDFDLVKVDSSEVQTQEGQILGTLEYMSPEQLKGSQIDARADVFSLGAILYECFSGVRANPGKNQRQLVRTLLDQGVQPLEEVATHIPKELCTLLNRTLSLDPEERPKDAQALAQLLRPLQHLKPALSLMSFGITPIQGSLANEISSTLDEPMQTPHTEIPTHPEFKDSFESLPITEEERDDKRYTLDADPKAVQTPVLTDPLAASASPSEPQSVLIRRLLLSASVMIGLGITLYLLGSNDLRVPPSESSQDNPISSHVGHEAPKTLAQAATKNPPNPTLQFLEELPLLPVPSSTWDALEVRPYQDPERGLMWSYRGGRLADRLGRLIYDLHFKWREGDPPTEAWTNSEALRWTLLERAPRASIMKRAGALLISQALRDELIAQRGVMHRSHFKVADVLQTPQGLIVIKNVNQRCSRLHAGDLIESMRWVVKGKRRLSGSCEGSSCLNAHEKSLKRRPSMMSLKLTLSVSRAHRNDSIWHRQSQRVKCAL